MDDVINLLETYLLPLGFEVHPFLIGWYNDAVSEPFRLNFEEDTIAFVIVSTPSMFENAFIPFLKNARSLIQSEPRDPLDICMLHYFQKARLLLSAHKVQIIQDFELLPNKRPKILVQTAAHVAGAAYYYQQKDITSSRCEKCHPLHADNFKSNLNEIEQRKLQKDLDFNSADDYSGTISGLVKMPRFICQCPDPWDAKKRVYGVCIHPKYGGWFAIRGVIILPDLQGNIPRKYSRDCVDTRQRRIELLIRFNESWRDWSYRDIIPVQDKYSELQRKYFAMIPKERIDIISEIVKS